MATAPFLTALAPGQAVQGSRDPLGLLPIWSRLGREVITNVTTVSGDLRGWTTLLCAVGMVEDGVRAGWLDEGSDEPLLRAEQIIAYSRLAHSDRDDGVRGALRVRARLQEAREGPILLGTSKARRILSDQRSAGVLGQIAFAADASGLIDRREWRLIGGRPIWDALAEGLPGRSALRELLTRPDATFDPYGRHEALRGGLASLHGLKLQPGEVEPYRVHILWGNAGPESDQARLTELWGDRKGPVTLETLAEVVQSARVAGHDSLAAKLQKILSVEPLLAACDRIFGWLTAHQRQTPLHAVARDLGEQLAEPLALVTQATDDLVGPPSRDAYGSPAHLQQLAAVRDALACADWVGVIERLLELNAWVMRRRGGAPWIALHQGQLDVRLSGEGAELPKPGDLRHILDHSYYLDQHRRLTRAWMRGRP